jgi:hypothetical protein
MNIEREVQIVNSFLIASKRERYVGFLNSKKGRLKFLQKLYHFADFDPSCIVDAPHSRSDLIAELRRRGAKDECYVMSVTKELDGVADALEGVIRETIALLEGSIVYVAFQESWRTTRVRVRRIASSFIDSGLTVKVLSAVPAQNQVSRRRNWHCG